MRLSKGFRVFLVLSGLALWMLIASERGPGTASAGVGGIAVAVAISAAVFFAAGYAGVFAHEMGHALAAMALTPGRPLIEIGAKPRALRLRMGRIDAHLGLRPGQAHCVCSSPPRSRATDAAIALAGPVASALVAAGWLVVWSHLHGHHFKGVVGSFAFWAAATEAAHALSNLVPKTFDRPDDAGRPRTLFSDGAHIRAALTGRPLVVQSASPPPVPLASQRSLPVIATMLALGPAGPDTEHLLHALLVDERTCELLAAHGFRAEIPAVPTDLPEKAPPARTLQAVMDAALKARSLSGHPTAEPEHFLLALLRSGDTHAMAELVAAGVDVEALRTATLGALARL